MPTRFKYAKTAPQTFGLSAVEILMATDAELNQYMGIKKYAPYRKNTQNWDKNRATRLKDLRTKIATRRSAVDGGDAAATANLEKPGKKRKGKKERMKAKAAVQEFTGAADEGRESEDAIEPPKKRRRAGEVETTEKDPTDVSAAHDQPSKKKRRRHKKSMHADYASS